MVIFLRAGTSLSSGNGCGGADLYCFELGYLLLEAGQRNTLQSKKQIRHKHVNPPFTGNIFFLNLQGEKYGLVKVTAGHRNILMEPV